MARRAFGVTTELYRDRRLAREHLLEIGAHGFDVVEVAAAAGHFDPSNEAAVADLQQWLAEACLDLHAVAAPPPDGPEPWTAGALGPVEQAMHVARRIPVGLLVLPVGSPKSASKAVERLAELAAPLGVTIAIDSRSPSMRPIETLVSFVERCDARVGIALDFATAGRGHLLVDAIETASEHLLSVRVPASSGTEWAAVLTTLQKVGYEGPFIIDAAGPTGLTGLTGLQRAKDARERIERAL